MKTSTTLPLVLNQAPPIIQTTDKNFVFTFFKEKTIFTPGARITLPDLYDAYVSWCHNERGQNETDKKTFMFSYRMLVAEELFGNKIHLAKKDALVFVGLAIKDEHEHEDEKTNRYEQN